MHKQLHLTIHAARFAIASAVGLASMCVSLQSSDAAQLPTLPQLTIDTTYSQPAGNIIVVNAGGNLQSAINNAALGDTIVLQAGATFRGPINLPNKTGSGWIYIQSSAYGSLPAPGNRVGPSNAPNMPKIVSSANSNAITTSSNAHHFRFVGIEFRPDPNAFVYNLIQIGNGESSASALPNNITLDRCYVHGDPNVGGRRGVAMNGDAVAVIDSYVADFKESGADTQAVWAYNSSGPFKIVNNYLESAGENVMFGGADPSIYNNNPSDIEIRLNHFHKPLSWMGSSWTVKNLLEFKNARRVLVEGNIFENNWLAAQTGMSLLITPRNQNGGCPGCMTQDITIRYNKMINLAQGINIFGRDNLNPSLVTTRVLVEHNEIEITSIGGAGGRVFQVTGGPTHTTIRHNTAIIASSGGTSGFAENSPKADEFVFQDNITSRGNYGWIGTGTAPGTDTLNAYFANYTFTNNAIIGPSVSPYPGTNFFPANTAAVGFTNFAAGDYRLSASSPYKNAATDGKDLGADIDTLAVILSGGTSGGGAALPPPGNLRVQ
jgi:hypothetical protein